MSPGKRIAGSVPAPPPPKRRAPPVESSDTSSATEAGDENIYEKFPLITQDTLSALSWAPIRVGEGAWTQAAEDELANWWPTSWRKKNIDSMRAEAGKHL